MLALGVPLSIFTMNQKNLEHFSFDATAATIVIWGICIGIFIAYLIALYKHTVAGAPVRALLHAEAFSPETAKTLSELGFTQHHMIQFELRHDLQLQKLLKTKTDENGELRYFIPEELKYCAELRYEKKANPVIQILFAAVLTVAIGIVVVKLLPLLLSLLDGIL